MTSPRYSLRSTSPYQCLKCNRFQSIKDAKFCDSCAEVKRSHCFKCEKEINSTNRTYLLECKDEKAGYLPNGVWYEHQRMQENEKETLSLYRKSLTDYLLNYFPSPMIDFMMTFFDDYLWLYNERERERESLSYCPHVPINYYAYQDDPYIERRVQREDYSQWWCTFANTRSEWARILPTCVECAFSMRKGLHVWNNFDSYRQSIYFKEKSQFKCY